MEFSITGARRDTGEDANVVVPVRDQAAAEQWAAANGILWTKIVPVIEPSDYAAEKDGVIWLMGCVATLLAVLLVGPRLDFSDATSAGASAGAVIGAALVVFLFGFLGAKLMGKRRKPARLAFAVVALAIVGLAVAGQYRIRRQEIADLKASGQSFIKQLGPSAGTRRAPATARSSTGGPTIDDLSASEAANAKLVLATIQTGVAESKAAEEGYQQRAAAIIAQGLIRPQDLDSAEHIAASKARIARLGKLIEERDASIDPRFDAMRQKLASLAIDPAMKESCLASFEKTSSKSRSLAHETADADRQFVKAATELADFIRGRLGHFTIKDNTFLFGNNVDVTTYNAIFSRISDAIAKENTLAAEQQKILSESTDTMQQFLQGKP